MTDPRSPSYSYNHNLYGHSKALYINLEGSQSSSAFSSYGINDVHSDFKSINNPSNLLFKANDGLQSFKYSGSSAFSAGRRSESCQSSPKIASKLDYPSTPNASTSSFASTKLPTELDISSSFSMRSSNGFQPISGFISQLGAKDHPNINHLKTILITYTHTKQLPVQSEALFNALCYLFSERIADMQSSSSLNSRVRNLFIAEEWFSSQTYLFSLASKSLSKGSMSALNTNLSKSQKFYETFSSDSSLHQKGANAFKEIIGKLLKETNEQTNLGASYSWINELTHKSQGVLKKVSQLLQTKLKVFVMTSANLKEETFVTTNKEANEDSEDFAIFYCKETEQSYILSSNYESTSPSIFGNDSYSLEPSSSKSHPISAILKHSPDKFSSFKLKNDRSPISTSPNDPVGLGSDDKRNEWSQKNLQVRTGERFSVLNPSKNIPAENLRRFSYQPQENRDNVGSPFHHHSPIDSVKSPQLDLKLLSHPQGLRDRFTSNTTSSDRATQPKMRVDSPVHASSEINSPVHASSEINSPVHTSKKSNPTNNVLKTIMHKNYVEFFDIGFEAKPFFSPQLRSPSGAERTVSIQAEIEKLHRENSDDGNSRLSCFYKDSKMVIYE